MVQYPGNQAFNTATLSPVSHDHFLRSVQRKAGKDNLGPRVFSLSNGEREDPGDEVAEKIERGRGVAASARREKWGNFHVSKETVHSSCTDPTQATARLVIVFVSRIQKSCARDISDQPIEMTRSVKVDHLQSWFRIFWWDET